MEFLNITTSFKNPLIYLDQNIYDKLRRGVADWLKEEIKKHFTVVYSDQTLDEIDGNDKLREIYLDILEAFDPLYMKLVLTEKFRITDRVQFHRGPVRQLFEKWKINRSEIPTGFESTLKMANKLAGGLKGIRFDELIDGQKQDFDKLMLDMVDKSKDDENLQPLILTLANQMTDEFDKVSKQMKDTLNERIKDQENFRGNKELHEKVKIGPKQLKNIKPPEVIRKIWDQISNSSELKGKDITFDKFFQLETNPIYPGEDYPIYSKVSMLYNVLNSVGYFPDKDIERTNRFAGSLCDSQHASNAIFCKYLMTGDHAMSMKCSAIYEYLGIGTQIIYVNEQPKRNM
jgi:hypothetical protein